MALADFTYLDPPVCNLDRFVLWQIRIRLYMNAIDESIYNSVLTGLPSSTSSSDDQERLKRADAIAMEILAKSMSKDILLKVADCTSANGIWNSLSRMVNEPIPTSSTNIIFDAEPSVTLTEEEDKEEQKAIKFCMMAIYGSDYINSEFDAEKVKEVTKFPNFTSDFTSVLNSPFTDLINSESKSEKGIISNFELIYTNVINSETKIRKELTKIINLTPFKISIGETICLKNKIFKADKQTYKEKEISYVQQNKNKFSKFYFNEIKRPKYLSIRQILKLFNILTQIIIKQQF